MAARTRRDPWRVAWNSVGADLTLAALLIAIAAALAVSAMVPQIPGGDAITRARTLSSLHVRYGSLARVFESLGLLSIRQSWALRVLVGLATSCIVFRAIDLVWRFLASGEIPPESHSTSSTSTSWLWTQTGGDAIALGSHVGAILIVVGLAISQVWGWEVTAVAPRGDGRIALPGQDAWVAYDDEGRVTTSPGLRVRDAEFGPGARVRAIGPDGHLLRLRQGRDASPTTELSLALTLDPDLATRDALFTVPQANLIIRVAPLDGAAGTVTDQLLVQAYRSPSGELAAEARVRGSADVRVGDVTIKMDSVPYAMLTAGYSPGQLPTVAGVIIVLGAIVVTVARQATLGHRLQDGAREPGPGDAAVEASGDGVG